MAQLLDPSGQLVQVDDASVDQALMAGFSQPSQERISEEAVRLANDERFGGLAGAGLATAAGAARGLTAGLSDYALQGFGVEPETLQGLKEAQPAASTIGELGSALASLPKAGVQAGIRAAAKGLAPGLFGAAGRAVESKLGGGLVGKVAGGATEGALWGAGNVVSESALGDPNLTAESALHEIGLSAAFGSGLAGAFGLGEKGLEVAAKKLAKAREAWSLVAPKLEEKGLAKLAELNKVAREDIDVLSRGAHEFGDIVDSPAARTQISRDRLDAVRSLESSTDDAMETALGKEEFDKLRGTPQAQEAANQARFDALQGLDVQGKDALKQIYGSKEAEALKTKAIRAALEDTASGPGTLTDDAVHQVGARLRAEIDRMKASPFDYSSSHVNELENLYDAYVRRTGSKATSELERMAGQAGSTKVTQKTASEHYLDLDNLKKSIDEKLADVYSKDPVQKSLAEKAFQGFRGALKETLENEDVWGQAARIQKRVNRSVSNLFSKRENALSEFGNRRLAKIGGYEAGEGFDPNKLKSLYSKTEQRLAEKQGILDEFAAATKDVDDVVRELGGKSERDLGRHVSALAAPEESALKSAWDDYAIKMDRAKSEFGNKRLEKIGEYEPGTSWDQKKFNSLGTQQGDLRGAERQAILNDYVQAAKKLHEAIEAHPAIPSGPRASFSELESLHRKATGSIARAQRLEEYSALAKPSRMSFGSSGMPQGSPDALVSGGLETLQWGAIGAAAGGLGLPAAAVAAGTAAIKSASQLIHDLPLATRLLAKMSGYGDRALQRAESAARALTRGTGTAGRTLRGPAGAKLAERDIKDQRKRFEERAAFIQEHSRDLIGSLASATGSLHEHAPSTTAAMQMAAARKLQFLASKIPRSPSLGILGGQASPPAIEIARFNALVDAVDDPLDTLHRASRGLATPEEIAAVRATSPALFAAYTRALIRHVAENEPRLTLAQKRAVARVTGQEMMTESAVYAAVQVAAQTSQAAQQQNAPMPQPRTRKFESNAADRLAPSGFGVGLPRKV